eukprot:m.148327 g.148327  ORF g.148327 m.148327 type:complete len:547 (-) comp30583_c0_seq1:35-1675(-)
MQQLPPSMCGSLPDHLAQLQSYGFNSSVSLLAEFMLSLPQTKDSTRVDTLCIYADTLFESKEFTRAKVYYQKALLQSKATRTSKNTTTADLKFKMYKCHNALGHGKEALTVLTSIPTASRTIEMNMALGALFEKHKIPSSAISCYTSVVKKCPLALEALQSLINLGEDVDRLLAEVGGFDPSILSWLRIWIRGHQAAAQKNYRVATIEFVNLQRVIPESPSLLAHIAEWQWKQGYLPSAKLAFEKVRFVDPLMIDKMDVYAHVLVAQGKEVELNRLCESLLSLDKSRVESWLALARYYQLLCENNPDEQLAIKHAKQGLLFVDKATQITGHHVELHMVKGTLLLALEDPRSASVSFREAYRTSRDFAAYQGLVSCYIAENRLNEALNIAKEAQQSMPSNPRAITLLGVVLKRYSDGNQKARKLFQRALQMNAECMDSVFALFELELEESNYEDAINLLSQHLSHSRGDYVHRRLADAHMLNNDVDMALKHYRLALRVNPDYEPAKEGIEQAMKALNSSTDNNDEEEEEEDDMGHELHSEDDIPETP